MSTSVNDAEVAGYLKGVHLEKFKDIKGVENIFRIDK